MSDAIGFVVALFVQINGVGGINKLGWSTVVIYLLLALGFAYVMITTHMHHDMPSMQSG